jgi:hypothetical protein
LDTDYSLEGSAPDTITSAVGRLAAQDEARHVAFGMSHLREHLEAEPSMKETLMNAVRRRHESLRHTAGLNAEVFDALVLLAAGSWDYADIGKGHDAVSTLVQEMHNGRKRRLLKLGFSDADAEEMSALHTRNFHVAEFNRRSQRQKGLPNHEPR